MQWKKRLDITSQYFKKMLDFLQHSNWVTINLKIDILEAFVLLTEQSK